MKKKNNKPPKNYQIQLQDLALKRHNGQWPPADEAFKSIPHLKTTLNKSENEIRKIIKQCGLYLYFDRYVAWGQLEKAMEGDK